VLLIGLLQPTLVRVQSDKHHTAFLATFQIVDPVASNVYLIFLRNSDK